MTTEEYIEFMIENGYRDEKDFSPLKCHCCESKNLKEKDSYYEEYRLVEYSVYCDDCGERLGTWAYGNWSI